MTDIATVRQQLKLARDHTREGNLQKAHAALKGVDHPKANDMRAALEARIGKPQSGFPWGRIFAFLGMLVIIGGSIGFWMQGADVNESASANVLPTLAVLPTSDCTPQTVHDWWRVQNVALDTFIQEASSASRTMPGDRLDERLANLRNFRSNFPQAPECATLDFKIAVGDLVTTMGTTIAILEDWSAGNPDRVTLELPIVQQDFRDARTRMRQAAAL